MPATHPDKLTVFGQDCRVQGQLDLNQDALMLGNIDGICRSSGKLTVGETGVVKGMIVVDSLQIQGYVDAEIIAYDHVHIMRGATVRGRIFAGAIKMENDIDLKAELQIGKDVISEVEKTLLEDQESQSLNAQDLNAILEEPDQAAAEPIIPEARPAQSQNISIQTTPNIKPTQPSTKHEPINPQDLKQPTFPDLKSSHIITNNNI